MSVAVDDTFDALGHLVTFTPDEVPGWALPAIRECVAAFAANTFGLPSPMTFDAAKASLAQARSEHFGTIEDDAPLVRYF